jgi:hypothetical protein
LSRLRRFERGRTVDDGQMLIQKLWTYVQTTRKTFVQSIRGSFVQQIEPAKDAMRMEEVVKLFSTAFGQICALKEVDKLVLEGFRIIFQAAKDYGPLLAHYEN